MNFDKIFAFFESSLMRIEDVYAFLKKVEKSNEKAIYYRWLSYSDGSGKRYNIYKKYKPTYALFVRWTGVKLEPIEEEIFDEEIFKED